MQDESYDAQTDRFVVPFQGEMIECHSIDEAILLKNAGLVIRDGAAYNFTSAELDDMTKVLVRLRLIDAAEALISLRSKMHAEQYLSDTVGYRRPTPAARLSS